MTTVMHVNTDIVVNFLSNQLHELGITSANMIKLSNETSTVINDFFVKTFSYKNMLLIFQFFFENIAVFVLAFLIVFLIGNFLLSSIESDKQKKQFDNRAINVIGPRIEQKTQKAKLKDTLLLKKTLIENKILIMILGHNNAKKVLSFKLTLLHTGLQLNLLHFLLITVAVSCGLYYIMFLFDVIDPFLLILIAITCGFYLSIMAIESLAQARIRKMRDRFPEALDVMNRSLRTGFDVERSIYVITNSNLGEISLEFANIYKRINIGIPAAAAVAEAIDRVPINEFKFFSVALKVHHEAGGNLTELIGNLAMIIRKRHELEMKIQTLSSEARMSSKILLGLPLILGLIFFWMNTAHFDPFFEPGTGKMLFLLAIILYVVGAITIRNASVVKA